MNQQNQSIQSPSKINWLFILAALLIGSLIGLGIFAYQYFQIKDELQSQTQQVEYLLGQVNELEQQVKDLETTEPTDETADWQVYRNEEYGYEFKYPNNSDWNLREETWLDDKDIILENDKTKGRPIMMEILLRVSKTAILEEQIDYWQDNGLVFTEPFWLDDLAGKKLFISKNLVVNNSPVHTESLIYLFNIGGNSTLFIFSISGIDTKEDKDLIEIFDQILSTFKFIE